VNGMPAPKFLADAERSRLEVRPVFGENIQRLVAQVYGTPSAVAQRAADMLK